MPNGDDEGGVQGFGAVETYDLSLWLYHHRSVYKQLKGLVREHWDPNVPSLAGEELRKWFARERPGLDQTLWGDRRDRSWRNVDWSELALYFSRHWPWDDQIWLEP